MGIFKKPDPLWRHKWANYILGASFLLLITYWTNLPLAVLFMISLVVHELGHGWALLRYGLGVSRFGFIPLGAIITPARKPVQSHPYQSIGWRSGG